MERLVLKLLVTALLAGAAMPRVCWGCTACYVSQERLVRHARLILEGEVVSVEDLPSVSGFTQEEVKERQKTLAQVRVTKVLKGKCGRENLLVLGGPYATCLLGDYYVHFENGEKLFLVLDAPLGAEKEAIIITHYNRVQKVSPSTMAGYIDSARNSWQAAVNRYRKADPQAMEEAVRRMATADGSAVEASAMDRYPVLACLRLLLNDPEHLPPSNGQEALDWDYALNHRQVLSKGSHPGVFVSSPGVRPFSPPGLTRAIAQRQADEPAEIGAFNAKLLTNLLVNELLLPTKLCLQLLDEPAVQAELSHPLFDPLWMSVPSPPHSELAQSVDALLMLAAPEPDDMRHRTFGLHRNEGELLPEVFLPYLERHLLPELGERRDLQQLLLRIPCPEIAALLRGHLEVNGHTAEQIFMYFARAGTSNDLVPVLDWQEAELNRFLRGAASLGSQVKELQRRDHADGLARMKNVLIACGLKETPAYRRVLALSVKLALMN